MKRAVFVCSLMQTLGGCRALPDLPSGECGNRVIEAPEDCDTFSTLDAVCRPPGTAGECHFDCTPKDGEQVACPPAFGCDTSHVCRRVTGRFERAEDPVPGDAETLMSGDFDGDGRADIVNLEPAGALGARRMSVHYFDTQALPVAEWTTNVLLNSHAVANLSEGDSRSDLLASGSAFGILLGQADRTLAPDIRPSYSLPGTLVRVVSIFDDQVDATSGLLVLAERDGTFELARPGTGQRLLTKLCELPGSIATLAGKPAVGRLFEDDQHPCRDLVLAVTGAQSISTYQACRRDETTGAPHFRESPLMTTVDFDPPANVAGGPLLADFNGDAYLDVFVMSDRGPYVAFGNGSELGALTPYSIDVTPDPGVEIPAPLAAGDFTGDGLADLVTPLALLVSQAKEASVVSYRISQTALGAPWSEACIGDVTGDGALDVVAASSDRPDLDWFAGTRTDRPNSFQIPTTHPARHLALGDFDGDAIRDVAFLELGAGPDDSDALRVAFGGDEASLDSPVAAGNVTRGLDVSALVDNQNDLRADLLVTHELDDSEGMPGNALSLLESGGRRTFLAPIQLSTFGTDALDSPIDQSNALAINGGHFLAPDRLDAVILGWSLTPNENNPPYALWLVADLASHRATTERLGWVFDELLVPHGDQYEPLVSLRSGDFDTDGIDEAVLAGPIEGGDRSMVAYARVDAASRSVLPGGSITLDLPCPPRPGTWIEDVDDDGANDVVLATGSPGIDGSVVVLFNDGRGGFDADDVHVVIPESERPRAVSPYRPSAGEPLRFAYVTDSAVRLVESHGKSRSFVALGDVAALTAGTGITVGDVNGDSVLDIAVADAGSIQVLKASLVGP